MPHCVDFCPIANPVIGHIKDFGKQGQVRQTYCEVKGIKVEFNLRNEEYRGPREGTVLSPVSTEQVPPDFQATCDLPKQLAERAREGGAGTFHVRDCSFKKGNIDAFAARVS